MKLIISLVSAFIFVFILTTSSYAVTTVTTVTTVTKTAAKKQHHKKHYCVCKPKPKHKKHYKKTYPAVNVYYSPGYCVTDKCRCSGYACYPGYYYQCRTEYYYREGGNSARVEVCGAL